MNYGAFTFMVLVSLVSNFNLEHKICHKSHHFHILNSLQNKLNHWKKRGRQNIWFVMIKGEKYQFWLPLIQLGKSRVSCYILPIKKKVYSQHASDQYLANSPGILFALPICPPRLKVSLLKLKIPYGPFPHHCNLN